MIVIYDYHDELLLYYQWIASQVSERVKAELWYGTLTLKPFWKKLNLIYEDIAKEIAND